ncbi:EAL domain-containing protein [Thiobacter aerophilum]|uniref:EAL domain-containing protein n=1 Tax=Thiobacter aerophilum TaxID=3121275 RepID=A0ABV0EGZ0_9BURK
MTSDRSSPSRSGPALILGFGLVCLLLAATATTALWQMRAANGRLERIVVEANVKVAHLNAMQSASRERALVVQSMLLTRDPFERDRLMLRFRELAREYVIHRDALRGMPLTPAEQAALEAARRKTRASTALMEQVVSLLEEERDAVAERVLMDQALPAQQAVYVHFKDLLALQQAANARALEEARRDYRRAFAGVAALGVAAVLLAIFIAVRVIRRALTAERALAEERDRAEITLHSIGDAVITTDAEGRVRHLNAMAERLTGWTLAEAVGRPVEDIYRVVDERDRRPLRGVIASALADAPATLTPLVPVLLDRQGKECAIEQTVSPIRARDGRILGAVVVFRDVTTERVLAQELAWQASHDPLTGLLNRHEFERRLAHLADRGRIRGESHVLLYLDLDQFKLVNDTCGHLAGDELLRQLAAVLPARLRPQDTLARLGGDEFGVLLPGATVTQGEAVAEALRQAIAEFRFVWRDKTFTVGASMGLVELGADCGDLPALLAAADTACYMAKERGRNRVFVHRASDAEVRRRYGEIEWVNQLTRAFEENRFLLYFQEIHPLPLGQTCRRREILLRMLDEEGRLVPPMAFIPAAERYNLMPTLDRWVVRNTFAWLAQNREALCPEAVLSINLSGQSLGDEDFADFVLDQLKQQYIEARHVCFEITETAAITNLSRALRLMNTLRAVGCAFSLDDFGSGMSSFAYLKNLPVDSLKIDGAFVRDMLTDPVDFAMVEAIARIGHVMGLATIAEYVENDETVRHLTALGVDYAQGYGVHRPEPLSLEAPANQRQAD